MNDLKQVRDALEDFKVIKNTFSLERNQIKDWCLKHIKTIIKGLEKLSDNEIKLDELKNHATKYVF